MQVLEHLALTGLRRGCWVCMACIYRHTANTLAGLDQEKPITVGNGMANDVPWPSADGRADFEIAVSAVGVYELVVRASCVDSPFEVNSF